MTAPKTLKSRYRYVKLPKDHPLSAGSGKVPEHRVILFEKIGPGEHLCHWGCGSLLRWLPGQHTAAEAITTDHIDNDGQNNDPSNLVPSCHTCNVRRGRDARFEGKLFVIHPKTGSRELATECICLGCQQPFLIATKIIKAEAKRGRPAGLYCTRDCRWGKK